MIKKRDFTKKKKDAHIKRTFQIITDNKNFQYVEAYKTLRTNLSFMTVSNEYTKIVVTSAIPGEGKSNIAINLAISLAESGKRVLVVDCDLRKPVMHKYLKIDRKAKGLTNVLSGEATLDDTIVQFQDLHIDVLVAGAIPPNPAEILGSRKMDQLISVLQTTYNYIIFDTPPVSVVTDAAVLGKKVDGAILVVRQNHATIETAKLAKKNLDAVNVNIIGAILNGFNTKKLNKDSGYYYSYEYDYHKQ